MEDFQGNPLEKALPGQPASVVGFEKVPGVGENFRVFPDIEEAKKFIEIKEKKVMAPSEPEEGKKYLNLILKADFLGSLEALEQILESLPKEKVVLRILKSEVGDINENDVQTAKSGKAWILGFRVKTNAVARSLLQREDVRVMNFEIIYDLVEGVRKIMERTSGTELVRTDLGKLRVLVDFWAEKNRQIVGGRVIDGTLKKGTQIEIEREGEIVGKGKMINLQRNKKDVEKVSKGEEAGILFEGDKKIEKGDTLIFFIEERKKVAI